MLNLFVIFSIALSIFYFTMKLHVFQNKKYTSKKIQALNYRIKKSLGL